MVVWRRVNESVWLPYSSVDGPRVGSVGVVSGFARTDMGAALAGMHLFLRSTQYLGSEVFEPTLDVQVVGPFRDAVRASIRTEYQASKVRLNLADGDPIRFVGAVPTAFHVTHLSPLEVGVEVVVEADHKFYVASYRLVWRTDDWRLIAQDPAKVGDVPVFDRLPAGYTLFPARAGG